METINKLSNTEVEVVNTTELKTTFKKEWLLAEKQRIENLLKAFD